MSEDNRDDANDTGARIGDLPASDQELNREEGGSGGGARPSAPWGGQPSPEATQPSPEATQPSPEATQPSPDSSDTHRSSPPPPDPEG